MKILLVRSRYVFPKHYFPRTTNEPLGLEYLAAAIKKSHTVEIFDSIAEGWNKYLPADNSEDLLYQGTDLKSLQKAISRFKPDVIGVTWIFSVQNRPVIETIDFIKKNNKDIPIIVGGSHPSANPIQVMEQVPNIDIVVFGEGEITLKELLDKRLERLETINGVVYRKENQIIQNPSREFIKNIDDIPLPARDLAPYRNYSKQIFYASLISLFKKAGINPRQQRNLAFLSSSIPLLYELYCVFYNKIHKEKQLPFGDIMMSRGCPNNCVFCAVHTIWKPTWRPHSLERVLEEIDYLVSKQGIRRIFIADDNFNISKENIIQICQAIVARKYNITFQTGPYLPTLDDEILEWLKKAGVRSMRLSIESGNQEVLDKIIRKRIDLSKVPSVVKSAQRIGFNVEGAFILGLPGETIETMNDTVNFIKRVGFDGAKLSIYQPFPNTDAYEICRKKGYLTKDYDPERIYVRGGDCFVKTEEFTPEDVLKIAKEFWKNNERGVTE